MSENSGQEQSPKPAAQTPGETAKPKSGWIDMGAKPPREVLPPDIEAKLRAKVSKHYDSLTDEQKQKIEERDRKGIASEGNQYHSRGHGNWQKSDIDYRGTRED